MTQQGRQTRNQSQTIGSAVPNQNQEKEEGKVMATETGVDPKRLEAFEAWEKRTGERKDRSRASRLAMTALKNRHLTEFNTLVKYVTDNPGIKEIPASVS